MRRKIIKGIVCCIYLFTIISFILGEVQGLRYVSVNPYKIDVLWSAIFIWVIIPAGAIAVLFAKSSKKWMAGVKSILTVIIILYFVLINFLAVLGRGTVLCSMTDDVSNYKEYDEWLEAKEDSGEFGLLPERLPENTEVEYNYFYSNGWEREYEIYLRVECESLQQYMKLKEEIIADERVKNIIVESDKEIVTYRLVYGSDVAKAVCEEKKLIVEYYIGNIYRND